MSHHTWVDLPHWCHIEEEHEDSGLVINWQLHPLATIPVYNWNDSKSWPDKLSQEQQN